MEASIPFDTREASLSSGLISSMHKQIGEMGHAELNPKIVYQYNDCVFVMRINRGFERKAILALSFLKEINGRRLGLYTIKTSGTIRSLLSYCKKFYLHAADTANL